MVKTARAMSWLREHLGGGAAKAAPPELPGRSVRANVREAVQATEELICETLVDGRGAPATAAGRTMAGERSAALLEGEQLGEVRETLATAVRRRLPLVVHGPASGEGLHDIAASGAFLVVARDAQETVDLTLVARRLAEMALVPGFVAHPRSSEEEDLLLPEPELIRRYLGAPDAEIASPTAAQVLLFGERRRRLPRWFDLDRPAAFVQPPEGAERIAALAGQEIFFADAVAPLAAAAMAELSALTGRPLSWVSHPLAKGTRHVIVAQGSPVKLAAAVAERLRDDSGSSAGVLGLSWLRPFPTAEIRQALAGVEVATVLEAPGDVLAGAPPLLRELRAILPAEGPRLFSARYREPLAEADLMALFHNMRQGEEGRDTTGRDAVWLGVAPPAAEVAGTGVHPRREALVQRVRREYPDLDSRVLPRPPQGDGEAPDRTPEAGGAHLERQLPLTVRRFAKPGSAWHNVARFWGELVEPRLDDPEALPSAADPYLALGAVPTATSTFYDQSARREQLPEIDASLCSGCGQCWTFCPDSAIAPVAIGTAALLNAAADRLDAAADGGSEATPKKLRRAFDRLAGRVDSRLASSGSRSLTVELLNEAGEWLLDKMSLDDGERTAFAEALRRIADAALALPASATDAFFHQPHQAAKGSGELLMLALDPQACQGCGVCTAVCPDDAVATAPQTSAALSEARRRWRVWEELPDTPGPTVARAAELPEIGSLPALLMSRHCLFSLVGGDGAEPGSGQRLAARLVTAVVEVHMQRRLLASVEELSELARGLQAAVRTAMAEALPTDDLAALDEALAFAPRHAGNLGPVVARLEAPGEHPGVDPPTIRKLIRSVREVEDLRFRITEGESGTGRARFGLVVAGASVARWAARFARNPWSVPVAADPDDGPELAVGLAHALLAERLTEARLLRCARARLAAADDLAAQEEALRGLTWDDLTPAERTLCPPVLVLGEAVEPGLGKLLQLLSGELPVKVVLLDDRDLTTARAEPVLQALAHRRAFVVSTSAGHPEHLFAGVTAALEHPGPALIHVHAPSPHRHGFAPDALVERARLAVDCRIQPLVSYDPSGEGVFGRRLDLSGNPDLEEIWARGDDGEELTPHRWLAGEERFAELVAGDAEPVVRERRESWATLQELAGLVTPFTERVRSAAEQELREAHRAELETLRVEHETRIAQLRSQHKAEHATSLRDRLMRLAGYGRSVDSEEGTKP